MATDVVNVENTCVCNHALCMKSRTMCLSVKQTHTKKVSFGGGDEEVEIKSICCFTVQFV